MFVSGRNEEIPRYARDDSVVKSSHSDTVSIGLRSNISFSNASIDLV